MHACAHRDRTLLITVRCCHRCQASSRRKSSSCGTPSNDDSALPRRQAWYRQVQEQYTHGATLRNAISEAVKKALDWIDDSADASKDDFQQQLKDLEAITTPIVSKLYSAGGAGGAGSSDSYTQEDDISHDDL